jgi:hypothetical protein
MRTSNISKPDKQNSKLNRPPQDKIEILKMNEMAIYFSILADKKINKHA